MVNPQFLILPEKKSFLSICKEKNCSHIPPLYIELPYKPPVLVYEKVNKPKSLLLESIKGTEEIARYSFIIFDPYLEFRVKDSLVEIFKNEKRIISQGRILSKLKELLAAYPQNKKSCLPPFQGGAIGLFSYDFVQYFERLPRTVIDDLRIPDAHFFIVDRLFAFDHREKKSFAIICPGISDFGLQNSNLRSLNLQSQIPNPKLIYDEAVENLNTLAYFYNEVKVCDEESYNKIPEKRKGIEIIQEMTKRDYMDIVIRAKEYIRAGDIFQTNLSQRFSAEIGDKSPWRLYKILRLINPSSFSAFADFGSYQIVSSSPERLIKLRDNFAETRPIAGTRPRGSTPLEDRMMRTDLILNEKERAEHIMLIDLERNDMGKVCSYGTVRVNELMIIEDYSHVIHIVSNIRGILTKERDAFSLIRATFPGGTITGVPKVRCMEIIDELEPVARGPYTGSLGYIGFNRSMDLNIIIRTFVIKDGKAYVQTGAGIVADSDPEREYYETLKKAEALLSTLERL